MFQQFYFIGLIFPFRNLYAVRDAEIQTFLNVHRNEVDKTICNT